MKSKTKVAVTAVSTLALVVDAAVIFFVPELRAQQAQSAIASSQPSSSVQTPSNTGTDPGTGASSSPDSGSSSSTPDSSANSATMPLRDGTYTGTAVLTRRGRFQVNATISGGKITAINLLSSPQDRTSESINQQAIPMYIKEALQAQSAQISLISGATETYSGFTGSLQNAINQAKGA